DVGGTRSAGADLLVWIPATACSLAWHLSCRGDLPGRVSFSSVDCGDSAGADLRRSSASSMAKTFGCGHSSFERATLLSLEGHRTSASGRGTCGSDLAEHAPQYCRRIKWQSSGRNDS